MVFYPTEPNSRDVLPMVRDLFSKHPEHRHHEAWELQHILPVELGLRRRVAGRR